MTEGNTKNTNKKGVFKMIRDFVLNFIIFVVLLVAAIFLYELIFVNEDISITSTGAVSRERILSPRSVEVKRDLNDEELSRIKDSIRPVIAEHTLKIDKLADDYAWKVKDFIIGKGANARAFGTEVFSLGNTLKFIGYWTTFQEEKFNDQLTKIWDEKMFSDDELTNEISEIVSEFERGVEGYINLMESSVEIEIENIVSDRVVPNIEIADIRFISSEIKQEFNVNAALTVKKHLKKMIAYEVVDFILVSAVSKFVITKGLALVGVSASATVASVGAMVLAVGAGVAINTYLVNSAIDDMEPLINGMLSDFAEKTVDGDGGIRSEMKKVAAHINSRYDSREIDRVLSRNIKVKEYVTVYE
jgi:hypothetical protein